DEALRASLIKSQFLANMSHELRTPLNAILGYSDLMRMLATRKGDAAAAADLAKISQAGQHLLGLINDLLDLSRIEAGRMDLNPETLDVARLLQEAAATVLPLAQKNANSLTVHPCPGLALRADAMRVRQCLFNLLSNACKFTENGRVEVAA